MLTGPQTNRIIKAVREGCLSRHNDVNSLVSRWAVTFLVSSGLWLGNLLLKQGELLNGLRQWCLPPVGTLYTPFKTTHSQLGSTLPMAATVWKEERFVESEEERQTNVILLVS